MAGALGPALVQSWQLHLWECCVRAQLQQVLKAAAAARCSQRVPVRLKGSQRAAGKRQMAGGGWPAHYSSILLPARCSIMVPYHGWRISHRTHHANHGHIENDESWTPTPK